MRRATVRFRDAWGPLDPAGRRAHRRSALARSGPNGAKDEFLLAATAQNLRELAKLGLPVAAAAA